MSEAAAYPQPTVTPTNQPLIDAWKRGELVLQHCRDCASIVFPPRDVCPRCWSAALKWLPHSGRGRVISASKVYSHVTEPFVSESPVTLAEIELEGGGAMLARVVTTGEVTSGALVALVESPESARYSLPTFRLIGVSKESP